VQNEHLTSLACILCGSLDTRLQTESALLAVLRCPSCGADFVSPPPSDELFLSSSENSGRSERNVEFLARFERKGETLSLLDVGCGDGSRLAMALGRPWRCFGVEPSDSARASAQKRLGTAAFLTDRIEHLVPCVFDVILLLNVLEHCPNPLRLFYALFTRGAIQPRTTVVISTANAGSTDSSVSLLGGGASTQFVSFSAKSLKLMLGKLRFNQVTISSLEKLTGEPPHSFVDEPSESDTLSRDCAEIAVVASGSDFHTFMKERYVPGTWLDLALYEHVPRYLLAGGLAPQKTILDLGCGTGYGAAMLARQGAASVVGLDIDPSTIEWAKSAHREKNLSFCVSTDLGAGFPSHTFDLVTCFEMIEHVSERGQRAAIASIARLLRKNGILLISTPNPAVTKLYGANPFHLRELTEQEFLTLLREHFQHIQLNYQFVHEGTLIGPKSQAAYTDARVESLRGTAERSPAAAFIAVCSNGRLPEIPVSDFVDNVDLVGSKVRTEHYINRLQLEHFKVFEAIAAARVQLAQRDSQLAQRDIQLAQRDSQLAQRDIQLAQRDSQPKMFLEEIELIKGEIDHLVKEINPLNNLVEEIDRLKAEIDVLHSRNQELSDLLAAKAAKLRSFEVSRLVRFEQIMREERWSLRKARRIAATLVSIASDQLRTCFRGWLREKSNASKSCRQENQKIDPNACRKK
jgi:2-polyprenyl-3-methyl-5-hydroxy-6-metoxy-1,4-benzoquinol methylase